MNENGYQVARNKEKTFRHISTIYITLYKRGTIIAKRRNTDKCGLEHLGQLMNIKPSPPKNAKMPNIQWKKVNWKMTETRLKEMDLEEEGGWKI